MRKIRKGDKVQIISGKDKGRTGTVLEVLTKMKRTGSEIYVLVESINMKTEFKKANPQQNEPGGILRREAPIPACKVALWDSANNKSSRVGIRVLADGEKVRFFKSSGEVVDV